LKIGNYGFLSEINENLMIFCISSLNEHSREGEKGTYFLLATGENGLESRVRKIMSATELASGHKVYNFAFCENVAYIV
jgi:hypothetical protein